MFGAMALHGVSTFSGEIMTYLYATPFSLVTFETRSYCCKISHRFIMFYCYYVGGFEDYVPYK